MRKIPLVEWGADHWSLLAYFEVRCVDHSGTINHRHLRCNAETHPMHAHEGSNFIETIYPYSTKLQHGKTEPEHDDWDCLEDLENEKIIVNQGTGLHPLIKLTDKGRLLANQIRVWKSQPQGSFATFKPTELRAE